MECCTCREPLPTQKSRFGKNKWTFVVLLLPLFAIVARWTMPAWNQIDSSGMVLEPCLLEWSHHFALIVESLHPQEHPIVDKLLHLEDVQSSGYAILDLVWMSWIPWKSFFLHFFFNWLSVSRLFAKSMSMWSSLLDDVLKDCKKVHRVFNEISISICFFQQEVSARANNDAYIFL